MSYNSNLDKEVRKIEEVLKELPIAEITVSLGEYLVAANIERIHEKGKDTKNTKIGNYNTTKPVYINPVKAVRKRGVGTPGKFKNGNQRKTVKYDSYKDYRQAVGRKTDTVNLNLTGKLQAELVLTTNDNKANIGFLSEYGSEISKGLEAKYGKTIWGVSNDEKKELIEIAIDEVRKYLTDNL
jgi:hypothetical protein